MKFMADSSRILSNFFCKKLLTRSVPEVAHSSSTFIEKISKAGLSGFSILDQVAL